MLGNRPKAQTGADNLQSRKGAPHSARRIMSRRFPPPGRSRRPPPASSVRDQDNQALAYVYFKNEAGRRSRAKLLTRDEAFPIAVNIAKLPSVPRQILKDIPRPLNSGSRDG
jgi:hypothetical protein